VRINLAQSSVTNNWSANFSTIGSTVTATPLSWNSQLAPNATATFGYCANKTGSSWLPSIAGATSP
jgi:cellulase/cellobiase CelA1